MVKIKKLKHTRKVKKKRRDGVTQGYWVGTVPKAARKNPKLKRLSYKQLRERGHRISRFKDSDRDRKVNILDCKPYNPRRQDGLYEIGRGGRMKKVKVAQEFNNLPVGQIVRWGGNMGWPSEDLVIVEKKEMSNYSMGRLYTFVSLKSGHIHHSNASSIKSRDDPEVWHSQHFFITNRRITAKEAQGRYTKAKRKRDEENERRRIKSERSTKASKTVNVGDIFYTSWGYDQTNYDFVVVTAISKTGKTATCKVARTKSVGHTSQTNIQTPQPIGIGRSFRMRIRKDHEGRATLRGSYPFCYPYTSKDVRLDTFWRHKKGREYHETDPQFGH